MNSIAVSLFGRMFSNKAMLAIISQVERAKPIMSVVAEDEKVKAKWGQQCFESLIENSAEYRHLVLDYFSKYYYG